MSRTVGRAFRLLALLGALGPTATRAGAQEASSGWRFTSSPFADLWFHGMALVDPIGPGPNPLYDPGYPAGVRRQRAQAQLSPNASDVRFRSFGEAFQRDPAFEVMHFVPLYFHQAERTEALTALALLAATDQGTPRPPTPRTSFGLAAVGSVLREPSQRQVLGEFVRALEEEWGDFYGDRWREALAPRNELGASVQSAWRDTYAPALAPLLERFRMAGGVVALVPSIDVEGRIFAGSPGNSVDNVLAVSLSAGSSQSRNVIFAMLRELSFPLVRQAMARAGAVAGDRNEEEGAAARAAIRSGALILEKYRPDDVPDYQSFFLTQAGVSKPAGQPVGTAFRNAFPISGRLAEILGEEILATTTFGGSE